MESATFCTNPTRTPKREQEQGCEEGLKDRPCAIVMAVVDEASEQQVLVLPITHTPPENEEDAVEIPATTKTRLGVGGDDGERSWIVISEANAFIWPSPDLRDVPGRDEPASFMVRCHPPSSRTSATDSWNAIAARNRCG